MNRTDTIISVLDSKDDRSGMIRENEPGWGELKVNLNHRIRFDEYCKNTQVGRPRLLIIQKKVRKQTIRALQAAITNFTYTIKLECKKMSTCLVHSFFFYYF